MSRKIRAILFAFIIFIIILPVSAYCEENAEEDIKSVTVNDDSTMTDQDFWDTEDTSDEPDILNTRIMGDADFDGIITSADALYVLRMSVQLEQYTEEDIPYFDVAADNKITSADSLELLRFSVKLPANERIGKPVK